MYLIVGLGNPGAEYDHTPHNIGFEVVDRLALRAGVQFRRSPGGQAKEAVWAAEPRVVLLKPQSYMNRSGAQVAAVLAYYRLLLSDLLVICDDANLPVGHLRFRKSGGPGGQRGLDSVIDSLGTPEFARLRIGVGGGYAGADLAGYVLNKWTGERWKNLENAAEKAADAVECFLREGLDSAMNKHNTRKAQDSPEQQNPPPGDKPGGE